MASLDLLDPRLRGPKPTAAPSSSQTRRLVEDEDESEWEYEYSATETETFYVTLDLSKADFKPQEHMGGNAFPSRGSWKLHRASAFRKATRRASHHSAASSAGSSDAERDDDDGPEMSRKSKDKQRPGMQQHHDEDDDDDGANPEKVQILELHSGTPIISYKGRVFSGQWCENITTELLMTRHDEDSSLPVLRHLEGGVDLLAASACRINVTEQKLKPKVNVRKRQRASAHLPQTVIPPVDPKASQERIDQRNFLADLIALKRRKGETDDVTIIARSMQGRAAKAKVKGARGRHRRGHRANPDKLHPVRGLDERPRRAGRKRGSGRARGKWTLFSLEELAQGPASVSSSRLSSPADGGSSISTPTPLRWNDLEEGQEALVVPMEEGLIEADMDDEQDDDNDEEEDDDDDNNDDDDDDEDEEDDQGEEMDEDED